MIRSSASAAGHEKAPAATTHAEAPRTPRVSVYARQAPTFKTRIREGRRYRLGADPYRAEEVTSTHGRLVPLTRGGEPLVVAFGDLYQLDAVGNTHRSEFSVADLEPMVTPITTDPQYVFAWVRQPRPKRRRGPA